MMDFAITGNARKDGEGMDREKVINGLEQFRSDIKPFCGGKADWERFDAGIAMLKEQEAVKPTFKQDEKGIFVWCCGSCGAYMYHIYDGIDKAKEYAKFCRQCGKPVLWEGR